MNIKARLCASYVQESGNPKSSEVVHLYAVYTSDPSSPNYSFSQATPGADMTMTISNPDAFGAFEQGKEYDLLFTPTAKEG
jgi:hypothetical protein